MMHPPVDLQAPEGGYDLQILVMIFHQIGCKICPVVFQWAEYVILSNHKLLLDRKTDRRQTDRSQAGRQMNGQTDEWTDRKTDKN